MIERYTLPDMGRIWSDDNKFSKWLQFEILACEAMAELGDVPAEAVARIKKNARFDVKRVLEIEEVVHHDVIAFLTNVAEHIGNDSRYVHLGLTSSDLLDTTLGQIRKNRGARTRSAAAGNFPDQGMAGSFDGVAALGSAEIRRVS